MNLSEVRERCPVKDHTDAPLAGVSPSAWAEATLRPDDERHLGEGTHASEEGVVRLFVRTVHAKKGTPALAGEMMKILCRVRGVGWCAWQWPRLPRCLIKLERRDP